MLILIQLEYIFDSRKIWRYLRLSLKHFEKATIIFARRLLIYQMGITDVVLLLLILLILGMRRVKEEINVRGCVEALLLISL
jgi:hypothetical protein